MQASAPEVDTPKAKLSPEAGTFLPRSTVSPVVAELQDRVLALEYRLMHIERVNVTRDTIFGELNAAFWYFKNYVQGHFMKVDASI